MDNIQLIECPRDAMQGWKKFIPTRQKIDYINALLKVGFHTIDFGSFVSAKAIPQMSDTKEVVTKLDVDNSRTKLLAIIANVRGAKDALACDNISYLGFPFSISPTFQQRNANSTIEDSFRIVEEIQNLCVQKNKILVVYISMAFGNPYGDEYHSQLVTNWVKEITSLGVNIISVADTVGLATAEEVFGVLQPLIETYPKTQIGVHLHSTSTNWKEKINAALKAGCKRFDGALKGIGGCPMANDELVGNIDTELLIPYFETKELLPGIDHEALQKALRIANQIFQPG